MGFVSTPAVWFIAVIIVLMTVLSLRSTRSSTWMYLSFHGIFINFSQVFPQLLIGTGELRVSGVEVLEESPVHIV